MLGAVLLRREQALGVAVARPRRPGDRVEARAACPRASRCVSGERADQRVVAELEQEEVRRRVDAAQRRGRSRAPWPTSAARRAARATIWNASPARMYSLQRAHARLVVAARGTRTSGPRAPTRRGAGGSTALEQRAIASGRRAAPRRRRGRGRSAAATRRPRTGSPAGPGPASGQRHGRLELGDPVVADVADDRLAERSASSNVDEPRPAADERVAPEPALLDRLEQEARRRRLRAGGGTPRAGSGGRCRGVGLVVSGMKKTLAGLGSSGAGCSLRGQAQAPAPLARQVHQLPCREGVIALHDRRSCLNPQAVPIPDASCASCSNAAAPPARPATRSRRRASGARRPRRSPRSERHPRHLVCARAAGGRPRRSR